ncbi:RNA polymerase sigma factor [Acholeplasma sp. OttesenSCG-928-E16]|nr:RNA polymerase sigma factor [Acholeplasma sp. OttesenSCG-928-E16]
MIENILVRFKNNDEKAFEEMFNQYYQIVFYIINKYIRDNNSAEELANDCLYTAYNNISSLKDFNKFEAWIYSIAKNKALNYLKKIKRKPVSCQEYINEIQDESFIYHEMILKLRLFLTEEELSLFIMKNVHDYTFLAISRNFKESVHQIIYRYIKIEEKIRKELNQ